MSKCRRLRVVRDRYVWCLHCEIVHKCLGNWLDHLRCQTPGCSGSMGDLVSWSSKNWPRIINPKYPVIPEDGEFYPLYDEELINAG